MKIFLFFLTFSGLSFLAVNPAFSRHISTTDDAPNNVEIARDLEKKGRLKLSTFWSNGQYVVLDATYKTNAGSLTVRITDLPGYECHVWPLSLTTVSKHTILGIWDMHIDIGQITIEYEELRKIDPSLYGFFCTP